MGGILPVPEGYQQIAVMEYDLYPEGFIPRIETYYIDSQYTAENQIIILAYYYNLNN